MTLVCSACELSASGPQGVVHGGVSGRSLHVAINARPGGDGSAAAPFRSIQAALDRAQPGTVVFVGAGTYRGKLRSVRSGTAAAPIRLVGTEASLRHDGTSRLFEIRHDHLIIEGFDFAQANILLVLQNASNVRVAHNSFSDAASECLRLRDTSTDNEVAANTFRRCGNGSFDASRGRKNGEAVYIGTAPEKLHENDRSGPDRSDRNWIHGNTMTVPAECVEVKEAARANLVESNTCTGGQDPNGAGLVSRGHGTVFRNNRSNGHAGAGMMLTGDRASDGTQSVVIGNDLRNNTGYGIKIPDGRPQARMCGNRLSGNGRAPATPGAETAANPC